jgi:excisionase family DNA binding protein
MTVAEIAAVLKLNQQTIRNWIDQGRLPAIRIGRRVRIKRSDFEELLTTAAAPAPAAARRTAFTAEQFWSGEPHPPPTLA